MQTEAGQTQAGEIRSDRWVLNVIALLDTAIVHLHHDQPAHGAILEATSMLRRQVSPQPSEDLNDGKERLLAWQSNIVLDHIDRHITGRVLVADLCALVQRSEAHFSRTFRRTFGISPHAYVIRRRVELAAQHMIQTNMPLTEIALQCGFVDQAHFCRHFRQITGETPAAWRRVRRTWRAEKGVGRADARGLSASGAVNGLSL